MESLPHGNRRFYDLPDQPLVSSEQKTTPLESLLSYINENIIGRNKSFLGPFGIRKSVYCDYTASGRSLEFIEDYIKDFVLPVYGNTHTTTTVTSLQTTLFRHEARDIIRNAVNASEHDAVIFSGSGCTGAVHKLITALDLTESPVVFCGPYEHHSNLLPWRELGSKVININETSEGKVDLEHLKHELEVWQSSGRQLIGCFAAASNITGVLVDEDKVSAMLHRHGALAFWDYATAGPYVKIDMNPVVTNDDLPYVYKDAIFISTHKFVGGVQTPGILVAKKKLFRNPVPSGSGGGSVFFVQRDAHRYLQETEMREEGGTPAIVESIRAGLVFQLKEAVGTDTIMTKEHELSKKANDFFSNVPNLVLLGPKEIPSLPIFSFLIRHPETGLFLHYNYVCALLNDMFGIQTRGGCACAGPYAQTLLGIDDAIAVEIENLLLEDGRLDRVHLRRYREYSEREILRPGFVRFNFPFFMENETVEFVLEAIKLVAEHGWKMLPQYNYNPETGEWRHRTHQVFTDRQWLGYISYKDGKMTYETPKYPNKGTTPSTLQDCLNASQELFTSTKKTKLHISDQTLMFDKDSDKLRWFLLPSEAYNWIHNTKTAMLKEPKQLPFLPIKYPKGIDDKSTWTKCNCKTGQVVADCLVHSLANKTSEITNILPQSRVVEKQTDSEFSLSFKDGFMNYVQSRYGDSRNGPKNTAPIPNEDCVLPKVKLKDTLCQNESIVRTQVNNDSGLHSKVPGVGSNDNSSKLTDGSVVESSPDINDTHYNGMNENPSSTSGNKSNDQTHNPINADKTEKDVLNESTKISHKSDSNIEQTKICGPGCPSEKCPLNENSVPVKQVKSRWHPPPKNVLKLSCEAIDEYKMIQDGDKVLVCLSGGKDSLSLLHTLKQYQFVVGKRGIHFDMGAVTIDPQTDSYDPSPLKGYLAELGLPYFYEEQCIMEAAKNLPYECASICSYCSRMKRGRIYTAARREGYNVLALGQHLDDLAESFLMSLFHNGVTRTMKASYTVADGDLRVIRPFVYVREKDLRTFAEEKKLPVIAENCPACFEAPKERHRMKQLLASQEILHPRLFHSLRAGLKPIMAINKTGVNVSTLLASLNKENSEEK